jgi:elongation factor 1-alpha
MFCSIWALRMYNEALEEGVPGDIVGFSVENGSVKKLGRGCVADKKNPPNRAAGFNVHIVVLNNPSQSGNGYTFVLDYVTRTVTGMSV